MFMGSSFYVSSFRTDRKAVRSGISTSLREIPGSRFARPGMTLVAVVVIAKRNDDVGRLRSSQ
jgi:hypothetical protein